MFLDRSAKTPEVIECLAEIRGLARLDELPDFFPEDFESILFARVVTDRGEGGREIDRHRMGPDGLLTVVGPNPGRSKLLGHCFGENRELVGGRRCWTVKKLPGSELSSGQGEDGYRSDQTQGIVGGGIVWWQVAEPAGHGLDGFRGGVELLQELQEELRVRRLDAIQWLQ